MLPLERRFPAEPGALLAVVETMKMPALAVVGADHRIVRSTETFRRRYEQAQELCERSPELELVLKGAADSALVSVGDLSVEIEAVTDAAGRRQAMLSLPTEEQRVAAQPPISALRSAADNSPAMVWVKDLDGRYLYVNPRYAKDLKTSEERLIGSTDADVPEFETVDGPRLKYATDGLEEPLQLEYTVPAVDGRKELAAFRFALRDETGSPTGTCGVAAPVNESGVAREEAARLMQLERWNRLDAVDVRAEVLEQWHVQAAPPQPAADELRIEEPSQASVSFASEPADQHAPGPRETTSASAQMLQADLQLARKWAERADELQGELHDTHAQILAAESEVQRARAEATVANQAAQRWRSELEQARSELERARSELAQAQAAVHARRSDVEAARSEADAARAHSQAMDGQAKAILRLSTELDRVLGGERERPAPSA